MGSNRETQSEEKTIYEEPEYKYSIIETDGSISDIDLRSYITYNTDSDSSGYNNNFKCAPNGDVFFFSKSNQELIVQFDGKTFEKRIFMRNDYIDNFVFCRNSLIILHTLK